MATLRGAASRRRALLGVGAALGLLSWAACGSDGQGPASGGGHGASATGAGGSSSTSSSSSTSTASSSSSSSSGGGEGGCAPEPLPPGVPDGWLEYTDWSCDCRFYVPGSVEALPAPIVWEDCPEVGDSVDCRMMVVDWTDKHVAVASNPTMELGIDGQVVLAFSRSGTEYMVEMVADADGPVHSAMIWHFQGENDPGCWLIDEGMNEGMHLYRPKGNSATGQMTKHVGALGGAIDELHPTLLGKFLDEDNPYTDAWRCGASWVLRMTWPFVMTAHPWNMSDSAVIHSPELDPEGMNATQPLIIGDTLFFTTATLYKAGINVWDPQNGFRPFIRWVGDSTRGAGNLGTDGVDLVWSEGEGKQPGDTSYPVRSAMTSPFTTDPAAVVPRRLRSEPTFSIALDSWQVGCGYAAHEAPSSVLVVRISDGWSWTIPNGPGRSLGKTIGITCEEVFALGSVGDHGNIARVRLDSLGPGVAPD